MLNLYIFIIAVCEYKNLYLNTVCLKEWKKKPVADLYVDIAVERYIIIYSIILSHHDMLASNSFIEHKNQLFLLFFFIISTRNKHVDMLEWAFFLFLFLPRWYNHNYQVLISTTETHKDTHIIYTYRFSWRTTSFVVIHELICQIYVYHQMQWDSIANKSHRRHVSVTRMASTLTHREIASRLVPSAVVTHRVAAVTMLSITSQLQWRRRVSSFCILNITKKK